MRNQPLRQVSNRDELETGFDEKFEEKWRRLELLSQGGMALFVLAAAAGLFGRGPFSHSTEWAPDGKFAVDFEPIVRWGTSTQITLHLFPASGAPRAAAAPVEVFVSSSMIEPLGLQQVVPQPDETKAVSGGAIYGFALPSGNEAALVRFRVTPSAIGPVRVESRQLGAGLPSLSWTQTVLP